MELIDRYVHEVGEHLPGRMRADVQAELRSLLMDTLEERARAAGRPIDAELVHKVLREFGPPEEVAERYAPRAQYLIGPQLFPIYRLVIGVVALVIGAILLAFLVAGVVRTVRNPANMPSLWSAVQVVGQVFLMACFNLGIITLVFAIVERVQFRPTVEATTWDPSSLPPVEDPDKVSPAGHIFSMYAYIALAILFNFYPQWVAIIGIHQADGSWRVSLLRPEFAMYMPFLNLWWVLAFVLNLAVLRQGRWRRETRWAEFGLGLFGIAVLYLIIVGPPVFRFQWITRMLLLIVLVVTLIESGTRLYRLLTRKPAAPWPAPEAGSAGEQQN